MPQTPSPNMQIVWPTDGDDANAWAPIMDTAVRVVIDGHNHSPQSGAQISISSLKFDADISFVDPSGGKHAITDLLAIDFFPSPPSAMTGFGGAFFVSDGTSGTVANELYFRSTLGTNIQFTSGGTMNVGAFAGTIGGDYVGVAAAEIFDDATDAYWFQQQVGAAVRQYAKMRSADLSLFEFKAVGSSPVPVQAVTLKSPVALAAGYELTFPGALPGSSGTLIQSDNTGILTFSNAGLALSGATLAGATSITGDATVVAGHTLTITDGAGALKGMVTTTTSGVDLNDTLAVSGGATVQGSPCAAIFAASSVNRYRLRNPPKSHETITTLSAVFADVTNANHVSSVLLRYLDHGFSLTTITGISFVQSGQSWVYTGGSPSVTLNGPAGRIYFLEITTGAGGTAGLYAVETTVTT